VDVRRLDLRFDLGRAEVTIVDAAGERTIVLTGGDFLAVSAAADEAVRAASGAVRGPRLAPPETPSQAEFWQTLYERQQDGWELMRAAPPLVHWFDQASPAGQRALVVGCGRGHEARMLASRGAHVVAVDFAADAIAEARRLTPPELQIDYRQQDLFTLGQDANEARYDLVVEHCCFCAIEPSRREEYVAVAARVLAPGGALVGLFRTHGGSAGPPFSVDSDELQRLFAPHFTLARLSVPNDSVAGRHGKELFAIFRPR
jgi:SAM-dependent methyltransferase